MQQMVLRKHYQIMKHIGRTGNICGKFANTTNRRAVTSQGALKQEGS